MATRLPLKHFKKNYGLIAFLLGLGCALFLFIPYMIYDHGYFIFYGDFNAQQIPFYQMVHDAFQNGDFYWSNTTDLGANTIGSYSFYLLGSPFFWITMLFPSGAVPYLMGPLLIIKFGCSSLSGYIYLRRYCQRKSLAVVGGLLYAFCGFSVYNIFFNHFHEPLIIFPLLLAAIDEYMFEHRKGVVALAVFSACIINYYFFVGQVVFIIIYWIIRICTKSFKISFKEILNLGFEIILGFLGSCILLLPSVLCVMQNSRVSNAPNSWDAVVYNDVQRYIHIIQSMFFPPDIAARPNFTPDSESKWASIAAWLPLVGMTGVIGFLQTRGKHWLKKLLPLLFVIAMVPIFNAAFQGFNMCYYARWFYMLDLMMILATLNALQNSRVDWTKAVRLSAIITVAILCLIGLMPYDDVDSTGDTVTTIGLENFPERFWIYGAFAVLSIVMFALIIRIFIKRPKLFTRVLCGALILVSISYGSFLMYLGKIQDSDANEFFIPYALNNGDDLELDDIKNVRSDYYNCIDNLGMFWKTPTIQTFHSIVPGSIMDFYESIGMTRDVNSNPDTNLYGIRGLLSVKYLFDAPDDDFDFMDTDGYTEMPGFSFKDSENGTNVFVNDYYVPMGFMYDDFICKEEYENLETQSRHLLLMKSMVLSQKQMKKYKDITHYYDGMYDKLNSDNEEDKDNFYSKIYDYTFTQEEYLEDCKNRKSTSCSDFEYNNNGFTATINNKGGDNLLFFSVPYEDGWTAYVNGNETDIEKVNVGFMAVKVPGKQESKINFVYTTPGFSTGKIISAVCGGIFIIYLFWQGGFSCKRKRFRDRKFIGGKK